MSTGMWWRTVLGENVTGVSLIMATDDQDIAATVVGTFTAISQDPPLVGFFVSKSSSSFSRIRGGGRFTANVLGARHETLSRAVSAKQPEAFEDVDIVTAPSGLPRLADAVAWFDAEIIATDGYGDHELIVGKVSDFGVGGSRSGLPLLFRRAGYGTFAPPAADYDLRSFVRRIRHIEGCADDLQSVSDAVKLDLTVFTQLGDAVVVSGAFRPGRTPAPDAVGASFPYIAPVAPVFAAWAHPDQRHAWVEGSRHLLGQVDRDYLALQLATTRDRGYGVAGLTQEEFEFAGSVRAAAERSHLEVIWRQMLVHGKERVDSPETDWSQVGVLQMPVFSPAGDVRFALYGTAQKPFHSKAAYEGAVTRLKSAAVTLSERL